VNNEELYKTIFTRRSVRSFDRLPLGSEVLGVLQHFILTVNQLDGADAQFEIVDSAEVTDKRAPHYVLAYCKATTAEFVNVGYALQKIDLYLQSMGFGTLWIGQEKPKDATKQKDFCIMLGFGSTEVPMRRNPNDFKRLYVDEISNKNCAIAHAARLAPSAMNSQPWMLDFHEEEHVIVVNYVGRGEMKAALKKKESKIDLGIVTRHIELALRNDGHRVKEISVNESEPSISVEY
jgi:nitroreductase